MVNKASNKKLILEMGSAEIKEYYESLVKKIGSNPYFYTGEQWEEVKLCIDGYLELTGRNLLID